jgi:class 3 adenylate cyclase
MSASPPPDPPILATEAVLTAAGRPTDDALRQVELRGISTQVRVATVAWS